MEFAIALPYEMLKFYARLGKAQHGSRARYPRRISHMSVIRSILRVGMDYRVADPPAGEELVSAAECFRKLPTRGRRRLKVWRWGMSVGIYHHDGVLCSITLPNLL